MKLVVIMMMCLWAEVSGSNCASLADLQAKLTSVECRMQEVSSQWTDAAWTATCEACKAFSSDTQWGDSNACTERNAECKLGQTMWYTRATFETWCFGGKHGEVAFYLSPQLAWQVEASLGNTQLCADAKTAVTTPAPAPAPAPAQTSNGFQAKCLASVACLVPAMLFFFWAIIPMLMHALAALRAVVIVLAPWHTMSFSICRANLPLHVYFFLLCFLLCFMWQVAGANFKPLTPWIPEFSDI